MHITIYDDIGAQFFGGLALSLFDRTISENAKRYTKGRVEKKLDRVTALQYLVEGPFQRRLFQPQQASIVLGEVEELLQ